MEIIDTLSIQQQWNLLAELISRLEYVPKWFVESKMKSKTAEVYMAYTHEIENAQKRLRSYVVEYRGNRVTLEALCAVLIYSGIGSAEDRFQAACDLATTYVPKGTDVKALITFGFGL